MSKDRAAPFSRKHRRYWLPVTGGMLLIGAINVGLGMCGYEEPSSEHHKLDLVLPPASFPVPVRDDVLRFDAPLPPDAAPDAPAPDAAPPDAARRRR